MTVEEYAALMSGQLGAYYSRTMVLFKSFPPALSLDFYNATASACERGKLGEVLVHLDDLAYYANRDRRLDDLELRKKYEARFAALERI